MFSKNWPDWLKGGVCLGILYMVFLVWTTSGIFGFSIPENVLTKYVALPLIMPFWLCLVFFVKMFNPNEAADLLWPTILAIISSSVLYFFIGALVGFIYGKMRRK